MPASKLFLIKSFGNIYVNDVCNTAIRGPTGHGYSHFCIISKTIVIINMDMNVCITKMTPTYSLIANETFKKTPTISNQHCTCWCFHYSDVMMRAMASQNHRRLDCLLNCLFRCRSKKISKLRVTDLCEGNPRVTGVLPSQRANNAENDSIWWRHHEYFRGIFSHGKKFGPCIYM